MKNLLKNTFIYVAGPLQFQDDGHVWREKVENELRPLGVRVLNPYKKPWINGTEEDKDTSKLLEQKLKDGKFQEVYEFAKRFRADDLRQVDISSAIICYINPKIVTFGTTDELSHALKQKKPVYIFIEGGKESVPLWICGMVEPKWIFNSLDEIIEELKKIDKGKNIDNVRWKFLKPEFYE